MKRGARNAGSRRSRENVLGPRLAGISCPTRPERVPLSSPGPDYMCRTVGDLVTTPRAARRREPQARSRSLQVTETYGGVGRQTRFPSGGAEVSPAGWRGRPGRRRDRRVPTPGPEASLPAFERLSDHPRPGTVRDEARSVTPRHGGHGGVPTSHGRQRHNARASVARDASLRARLGAPVGKRRVGEASSWRASRGEVAARVSTRGEPVRTEVGGRRVGPAGPAGSQAGRPRKRHRPGQMPWSGGGWAVRDSNP